MATTTLKNITAEMRDYNRHVASERECAAWLNFVGRLLHAL